MSLRQRASAVLSAAGMTLLVLLMLICVPLTVPRLFGYHIYSVVSGSMEPAIPVGSLVYIAEAKPAEIKEEDVIAFYGAHNSGSIITHRVVENRMLMGQFITKGDANAQEDMEPVPYENLIGKVVRHIPGAGRAAELFTSPAGKGLAAGAIVAAVLLQTLASAIGTGSRRTGGKRI